MEKFLLFLMQGIPESMGYVALSLALTGVPLRWGRVMVAGTILCVIFFIMRALPVTFGLHTVAGMLLLVIFITKTTNIPPSRSFVAVFASFATLAILELIIHQAYFTLTKMDSQGVMSNSLLWKLLGFPQAVLLIILAVIVSRYKKPVQGVWKI